VDNGYSRWLNTEPRNKAGEILLSHNHIALLHGLYDRPNGTAPSTADLARAALPYVRVFREYPTTWLLEMAAYSLRPAWVTRQRPRHRHVWTITERGVAILERTVPAHIRGFGRYHGLTGFRGRIPQRPAMILPDAHSWVNAGWNDVDRWWDWVAANQQHGAVADLVTRLVERWASLYPFGDDEEGPGFLPVLQEQLRRYICHFVMSYRVFPRGVHLIPHVPAIPSDGFSVDFDELQS
jgi:hypothetical protein